MPQQSYGGPPRGPKPLQVYTDASMTGTTAVASTAVRCAYQDNVSFQVKWTGTPVGTLIVQVSNKEAPDMTAASTDFDEITVTPTITSPAGGAGGHVIGLNQVEFLWVRLRYTNASSTGTLNAWANGKAL